MIKQVKMPVSYESNFDQEDLDYVFDANKYKFEKIWYWYGSGYCEGAGEAIIMHDNLWFHVDIGHCSCYGPEEGLDEVHSGEAKGLPFGEFKASFEKNPTYWKQIKATFSEVWEE